MFFAEGHSSRFILKFPSVSSKFVIIINSQSKGEGEVAELGKKGPEEGRYTSVIFAKSIDF